MPPTEVLRAPATPEAAAAAWAPETAGRRRPSIRLLRRPSVFWLFCGLGFLMAALIIRSALAPRPYLEGITTELGHYLDNRDAYSVLFLGTSRTRSDVDPRVFDRVLNEAGFPVRSYNLGVDALSLIEQKWLVEEILRAGPSALRYIFVEPAFRTHLAARNIATQRGTYFRDIEDTWVEIASNLQHPRYRTIIGRNALACLYHYANLGRLAPAATPEEGTGRSRVLARELEQSRGFLAMDADPAPERLEWHRRFTSDIDTHLRQAGLMDEVPAELVEAHSVQNSLVMDLVERLQASGLEVILLLPPTFHERDVLLQFSEAQRSLDRPPPTLSYLARFWEIYDPHRYWWDIDHLNREGAKMFTRRLARDFSLLLRSSGASITASQREAPRRSVDLSDDGE